MVCKDRLYSNKGELNIVSESDINLDTFHSKLHVNSRRAKQIRNLPESIKYREDVKVKLKAIEKWKKENEQKMIKFLGDD